jgi:drug/metabolite transporter (DMT)-like permease
VASISWGSILVRLCASAPLTISLYRVLLAAILIAPVGLPALRRPVPTRAAIVTAIGAGLFLSLHFATWIASLSFTTIAASTILVSTQPVFSAVLSALILKERPAGRSLLALALALSGIVLIVSSDFHLGSGRLVGDLLALSGALFAAIYLVMGRAARSSAAFPAYLLVVNASAAAGAFLLALVGGQPIGPERGDLGWLLLMAMIPHLLGHGALNWAVRHLPAFVVNITVLGEPVLATLYAFLLFGEVPAAPVYPGALLIGTGVYLAVRIETRRDGPKGAL